MSLDEILRKCKLILEDHYRSRFADQAIAAAEQFAKAARSLLEQLG